MDNKNLFLTIMLVLILMLLWTRWNEQHAPKTPTASEGPATTGAPAPGAPAAPAAPAVVAADGAQTGASTPRLTLINDELKHGQRVRIDTDIFRIDIDTRGGDIRYVGLKRHPEKIKGNKPFTLLSDKATEPYVTQSGFVGDSKFLPNHKTLYRTARTHYTMNEGEESLVVDLVHQAAGGVSITKRYHFRRDSYTIRLEYVINNGASTSWRGYLYNQFMRKAPEAKGGLFMMPTYTGGAIYTTEERYEKISFSDMDDEALKRDTTGGWAAFLQHYFVAAWMAADKQPGQLYTNALGDKTYHIGYLYTKPLEIAPGASASTGIDLYLGPKETARLEKLPEGMPLTVDYTFLTFIAAPLFWLLSFIHGFMGNWGWAIIMLTVLIKAVFYPLNNAQYRSMAKMKKLTPRMQELKTRYGKDRERYQREMMELYKKEKLNPMAGCLPILVQIPVFIALYWVLLEAVEMRHAPWAFWISDLSARDPYYILPVLMGASMFVTMLMSPATDPVQRRIFMAMPIVFTVFFLFFPAGLVLYWLVNNLLQIVQQWWITRSIERGR